VATRRATDHGAPALRRVQRTEDPSTVVGTSLAEFLGLGCLTGYHLDDLAYFGPNALPDGPESPEEPERVFLLKALTEEFDLAPWPDVPTHLEELQTQHAADIVWTPYSC
jgi:hypothetical protein